MTDTAITTAWLGVRDAALTATRRGWPVVPCSASDRDSHDQ